MLFGTNTGYLQLSLLLHFSSFVCQCNSHVVPGYDKIAVDRQCLVIVFNSLLQISRILVNDSHITQSFHVHWIPMNCGLVKLQCFLIFPELRVTYLLQLMAKLCSLHYTNVVISRCIIYLDFQCLEVLSKG